MLRLLLSFFVSVILFFPFSIYVAAEEQGAAPSSDNHLLLEIRDFNQPSPFETTVPSSSFVTTSSNRAIFSDVPLDHWAKKEIEFLYNRSIIQGYEQGDDLQFRPNEHVTRAQAAKMLMKVLGEQEQSISYSRFKDIPSDHWAAGWIERAVEKGIFEGYSDGTFHPNDPLKRSQMSKIIALAFQLSDSPSNKKNRIFADVSSDYWASPYILKLYYNGISNGNQNKFMPEAYISRDQFSAFLARAMSDDFRLPVVDSSVIATGKVTAKTLNIRSAANANASIVGKLPYGTVVNVYEINGYWAKISYRNVTGYVHKSYLKLKNVNGNPIKGRIITVDAGHGGTDSGTIGNGVYEKNIVLSVAKKLQQKLEKAGAKVIMTRADDKYKTLEERVQIAKNNYAELFVSIHVNSGSSTANGTETYYDTSKNPNGYESYLLAKEIQEQIVTNADMFDRGVKDNNFYVIRYNTVPSVLVELGFISNSNDVKKLTSDDYQNIFAESIYNGILQYYSE